MAGLPGNLALWLCVWLLAASLLAVPGSWARPTSPQQTRRTINIVIIIILAECVDNLCVAAQL